MSILEEHDKKFELTPLTAEKVLGVVGVAESVMANSNFPCNDRTRAIVWMNDRIMAMADRLGMTKAPELFACGWCFLAAGLGDDRWVELPKMSLAESQDHAQVCEHNPLVQLVDRQRQELHVLQAANADIQGRVFDVDLRDAIHVLLKSDMTAFELRRALGELVR